MTQRDCCCCAIHPNVSWPNRNTSLQRCGCASKSHIRLSSHVSLGFHTDVCFYASGSLCEPVFAKIRGRQQSTSLWNRDPHRAQGNACWSILPVSRHKPHCIFIVHACMYGIKPLLQPLFLEMITLEAEEKGGLLDHLELQEIEVLKNLNNMKEVVLHSQLCRPQPWYQ